MKRPSDGITEAKLTPYENLFHSILLQAVNDIKYAKWKETTHIYLYAPYITIHRNRW